MRTHVPSHNLTPRRGINVVNPQVGAGEQMWAHAGDGQGCMLTVPVPTPRVAIVGPQGFVGSVRRGEGRRAIQSWWSATTACLSLL